jgi:SAM-dependent methyltransferase
VTVGSQTSSSHYDRHYAQGGFRHEERRPHWRDWVQRHYVEEFGLLPGERILDIPCGDGFWSSVLTGLGFEVVGIDLSRGGVEVARNRYPGIEFLVGDAEAELPVEEHGFDVVFSRGISHLHHVDLVTDSSLRMARNLMRYVRPGGLLLVSYNTRRDGSRAPRHAHHPVSDLVRLFESAGDVCKVEVVGSYVQIGVQHWDAPRKRTRRPASTTLLLELRRIRRGVGRRLRAASLQVRRTSS